MNAPHSSLVVSVNTPLKRVAQGSLRVGVNPTRVVFIISDLSARQSCVVSQVLATMMFVLQFNAVVLAIRLLMCCGVEAEMERSKSRA